MPIYQSSITITIAIVMYVYSTCAFVRKHQHRHSTQLALQTTKLDVIMRPFKLCRHTHMYSKVVLHHTLCDDMYDAKNAICN